MTTTLDRREPIQLEWFQTNLQVFVLELKKQIRACADVIEKPDSTKVEKIVMKDDHLNNLRGMIESRCFKELAKNVLQEKRFVQLINSINAISQNLERIGDFMVNMAKQTQHFTDSQYFNQTYDFRPMFDTVEKCIDKIDRALFEQDIQKALEIGQGEAILDEVYEQKLAKIIKNLEEKENNAGNHITSLFIFQYLERTGDILLNISEAVISSILGDKLKINQVNNLKNTLGLDNMKELQVHDVKFSSIWGTRSGCRIGEVVDGQTDVSSIFKEGDVKKLTKERDNIEMWNKLIPGIAPKVLSFEQDDSHSTILVERLYGQTLKEAILNNDEKLVPTILDKLESHLGNVWGQTISRTPIAVDYMKQLNKRLSDVYFTHSELKTKSTLFGQVEHMSLDESLEVLRGIENEMTAPFSILGHGDFNIDNLIYNPDEKRIHYIDLHRSRQSDHVQDVSVFMISAFRLPVFDKSIRKLIMMSIESMYAIARIFSEANGDTTFHYRLALGLARSLTTSTRFELNKNFAKEMFLRADYLMNALMANKDNPEKFEFPMEILHYEK